MKTVALLALVTVVVFAADDAAHACAAGDVSCEAESDELSMLSLNVAKHQAFPTHKPGDSDPEPEETEEGSPIATGSISDEVGLLEHGNKGASEAEEHIAHMLSKLASHGNMTNWLQRHATSRSFHKLHNAQFFKPRYNLCKDSFTGVSSCTVDGCASLVVLYSTMANYCHPTLFYSNGDMCRCFPSWAHHPAQTWSRYHSSTGNSIYQLR